MPMECLIFYGVPADPHLATVASALSELGIQVATYSSLSDLRQAPDPVSWTSTAAGATEIELNLPLFEGGVARVDPHKSVWWLRNKFRLLGVATEDDQRKHFELDTREAFARSIMTSCGARGINAAPEARELARKIVQLQRAAAAGFRVPATLVSTSKKAIRDFVASHGRCIIKPLQTSDAPPLADEDGLRMSTLVSIMTNEIAISEVEAADPDEFLSAPAIIQERIEKDHELRVVAFGCDICAYKVHSQGFHHTKLDWRRGEAHPGVVESGPVEIKQAVKDGIAQVLRACRLDTAVFDFAVTKTGEVIFFECNPAGQWGALECPADREISRMFARNIQRMFLS
jgi:hypothetical protein